MSDEPIVISRALTVAAVAALAGVASACSAATPGGTVDSWMSVQTKRLTDAGVTFPPEQGRNTVINMVAACLTSKKQGDDPAYEQIWEQTTQQLEDWISPGEAQILWHLTDPAFCASVPDAPLGST